MQEVDAERRLAILRGEALPPLPEPEAEAEEAQRRDQQPTRDGQTPWAGRRKRKRAGEDDTDFEMRVAHERLLVDGKGEGHTGEVALAVAPRAKKISSLGNAPLTDQDGHIALFPMQTDSAPIRKNAEAEAEKARKQREYEDQYTMRFSNAAGYKTSLAGGPWYAAQGETKDLVAKEVPGKDVWGNEDPRRKDREAARIVGSDPLAMMKRGAAKVREVERERRVVNEEKARELKELKREERRGKSRHRRRDGDGSDRRRSRSPPSRRSRGRDEDEEHEEELRRQRHRSRRDFDDREHESRDRHRHGGHRHTKASEERLASPPRARSRREVTKTDHY